MSTTSAPALVTLDCRQAPPGTMSDVVLETFDRLAPGERVRVVGATPLTAVLEALRRERAHAFDWFPVSEGPERWEADVHRRPSSAARPLSVREAMDRDHHRLDQLEEEAFAARLAHRYAVARGAFAAFAHGLRRHIEIEEQIVLPEFEARSGIAGEYSAPAVMRAEHRAIATILGVVEREVGDPQAPVELSWTELRSILHDHHLKEDQLLYPALDRLLSEAESEAIVARAQAWTRG